MSQKINYRSEYPETWELMQDMEAFISTSELQKSLVELVKILASRINRCAFCMDLHTRRAMDMGIDVRRITAVTVWEESPFFDERERAAFALTDHLARMSEEVVPEHVYEDAHDQFSEEELVALVIVINTINAWNRLWVSFRCPEIPEL